jgi:hypothetical protein
MRSHWRHRLAGLVAAIAVAIGLAIGSAQLATASAPASGVPMAGPICPAGTHWDNVLHACV